MIRRIGIVGGGHMGSDLFGLLSKDYEVVLVVRRQEAAEALSAKHLGPLQRRAERDGPKGEKARQQLARMTITTDMSALADVDMVTENIVEDLEIKRETFKEIASIVRSDTILTTNSSFTIPSELASVVPNPERFVGYHFFFPTKFVPFVEVIPHAGSDEAAVKALTELSVAIGKRPLHVGKEIVGFLVNRIIGPFYTEGLHLLGEGYYTASQLDQMCRGKLTVSGPMESVDQIGTDVVLIGEIRFPHEKRAGDYTPAILPLLVERGWLGQKAGVGCYLYVDGKPQNHEDLPVAFGREGDPGPYTEAEVRDRLLYGVLLESYKMRDLGVADEADIEWCLSQILGLEEGPFAIVRRLGRAAVRARMVELEAKFGARFAPRFEFLDAGVS